MSNLINLNLISLDLEAANKEEVLTKLAGLIQNDKKLNCVWKKMDLDSCQKCEICHTLGFVDALKEREESYPTSVGYSFAIPHGKCNSVVESAIAFARLKNEVEWDEDEEVKYVFMIAVSEENATNEHLEILIKLSKSILNDEFREKLEVSSSEAEVLELLNKFTA